MFVTDNETIHVHHWHKRRIICYDTKTINQEDLPFIECCCRCNQEREILPDNAWEGDPKLRAYRDPRQLDKIRKQEQKREFEGADLTLSSYWTKKAKKLGISVDELMDRMKK
jgi:hypothetical protein